jgi:hypothetical protein
MLDITFKPEFEQKLEELGVRDKFINNLVTLCDKDRLREFLNACENDKFDDFECFIIYSFDWEMSLEGCDFWEILSSK